MKISLTLFLLILAFQITFGQENPQPRIISEFDGNSCSEFRSYLDNFLNEIILEKTDSIGYVIIYSNDQDLLQGLRSENKIIGHFQIRFSKIDFHQFVINNDSTKNKLFIIRKKTEGEFKIQFWKTKKGEKPSFAISDKWDLSKIKHQKSSLFFTDLNESECNPASGIKQFSEILSANPNLHGHIVIFDDTQIGFLKTKSDLLGKIPGKLSIVKNRMRTFFIKDKGNAGSHYELWLIPKKKSH